MSDTGKILSWILKGGLLLTPFLVLVVTRSLYFPFITGKNFAFRILVEILAAVWVFAALKFKALRPRSSLVAWAVVVFIAVMGVATTFSLSPYHSFWSNFERMEGYIGLLHFLLYFLLLGSVFTRPRDWTIFFHTSIGVSAVVALYAMMQLAGKFAIHQGGNRVDATFGNATYLAAYLLFHLFFLIWFFLRSPSRSARVGYAAVFLLEALTLYFTATRGAMLGFLGGLVVLATLLALLSAGRIRRFALAGLGAVMLVPILFFFVKDAPWVQRNLVLGRFATLSFQETTTQARFTIWGMALQGWKERPILGWGQESFVYIFSKHYQPSLWRQEPWFDRAHNVFLDWLTAGGVLGLASYLGMFAAAGWLLVGGLRSKAFDRVTVSVIAALLAAHFFQNLFVFENLTSYLLFFAVLAHIHVLSTLSVPAFPSPTGSSRHRQRIRVRLPAGLLASGGVLAALALALVFYFANVKPIFVAKNILDALKRMQQPEAAGKIESVIAILRKGIQRNTFGTTELREQASQIAGAVGSDPALASQDKQKYFEFVIQELEGERMAFPFDMRAKAFLATLYLGGGRPADALAIVNEALEVSGQRAQFYFIAAEAYLNANQHDRAIEVLRRAYNLSPEYPEAIANLATVLILAERDGEAEALLEKHYGQPFLPEVRYAQAYVQRGKFDKALLVWKEMVKRSPENAQHRANLGLVYARVGQTEDAIRELHEAIRLEPGFKQQGEELIGQIRAGRLR